MCAVRRGHFCSFRATFFCRVSSPFMFSVGQVMNNKKQCRENAVKIQLENNKEEDEDEDRHSVRFEDIEADKNSSSSKGKKFLKLGLLKDPLFLLFCAREFTTLLVIDSFYVFSIDLMVQKGNFLYSEGAAFTKKECRKTELSALRS